MRHLEHFAHGYDQASRVTSETDKEGTASFTYDAANEVTGVTGSRSESYSYDLNGNRTGTGYHTTIMNEQTTSPGNTYTYDRAGNLISDNNGTTITTYTYDYENRLTEVTVGGTIVATYTYDALGRRIGVDDSGTQTWTVYDGTSADANAYADFNGSDSLGERYLFGPNMVDGAVTPGILARTNGSGTTAWYLTDKLGTVRDIVNTSGTNLDHIVYDSFGNIVTETNATNGDRFKFAGMEYDATTGQNYDRARYYDEAIGRFMGQDPMGFQAGDAELYRYVGNGPTDATDPSGLLKVEIAVISRPARNCPPGYGSVTVYYRITDNLAEFTTVVWLYAKAVWTNANGKMYPALDDPILQVKLPQMKVYTGLFDEVWPESFWEGPRVPNVKVQARELDREPLGVETPASAQDQKDVPPPTPFRPPGPPPGPPPRRPPIRWPGTGPIRA